MTDKPEDRADNPDSAQLATFDIQTYTTRALARVARERAWEQIKDRTDIS